MERLFCCADKAVGGGVRAAGGAAGSGPRIGRWPSARLWVNAALSESVSGRSILLRMCPPPHFRARSHTYALFTRCDSPSRPFAMFVRTHTYTRLLCIAHAYNNSKRCSHSNNIRNKQKKKNTYFETQKTHWNFCTNIIYVCPKILI